MPHVQAVPTLRQIGNQSMPLRIFKIIWAYLSPSEAPSGVWLYIQIIGSAIIGWLYDLPVLEKVFWMVVVFDLAAGWLAGSKNDGVYSWKIAKDGMIKKAVVMLIVRGCWVIAKWLNGEQIMTAITVALIVNEGMSVSTNLKSRGIYVPELADFFLAGAKKQYMPPEEPPANTEKEK